MDDVTQFNKQLLWLLIERQETQQSVAQKLGWTAASMSRRLAGKTPWVLADVIAIAKLLDVGVLIDVREGYAPVVVLPRLDSNQEPTGYRLPAVAA